MEDLKNNIESLAETYSKNLRQKIEERETEMEGDDNSHYLIYRVLGITDEEGKLIDSYQNTGRFLYNYAGAFLEEVTTLCFNYKYPEGEKTKIPNTEGERPKTFEIDFLNGTDALEVKWRDATTDGDHITKEHIRIKAIKNKGYKPIRIMFYYPLRDQAKKIQQTLKTLYAGVDGEYYADDEAWTYINTYTGVDLKQILTEIAEKKTKSK